jgi:hypothetical protein
MDNKTKESWDKAIQELHRIANALSGGPPQQNDQPVAYGQSSAEDGDSSSFGSLVAPNLRPRPKKGGQAGKKWYQTFTGWKPIIEVVGIVFGIAYAIVTYCQWRDANRNFKAGQRAWILIEEFRLNGPLQPSVFNPIKVTMKNYGQSPALYKSQEFTFSFEGTGCKSTTGPQGVKSHRVMAQGQEAEVASLGITLTPECLQALATGKATLKISGIVSYQDIFHRTHTTEACAQYDPIYAKDLVACADGNTAE